ncbi:hypothetical protein MITS9508_01544 [Synechococcus sp. MIT S9508]|nr:hypothetical protein MITS9508_01544 [Synechococcus sp. MIT S9508]
MTSSGPKKRIEHPIMGFSINGANTKSKEQLDLNNHQP